jgi:serine/threonine protein kinase
MVTPSQLRDRYRIIQVLEQRDLGTTYLAEDTQNPLNQRCVIQQFLAVRSNEVSKEWIETQAYQAIKIWENLKRANALIPELYTYFEDNGTLYLVYEWVDGISLKENVQIEGVWNQVKVYRFLKKLLPTLCSIHDQKLLHRNLTSDNIRLRRSNGEPVLLNFNSFLSTSTIASVYEFGDRTRVTAVATSGFMPPEQERGKPVYASDVYSLGFIAIYLLTGKLPHKFQEDPHTGEVFWYHDVPDLNSDFTSILRTATALRGHDRYQTAADFLQALEQIPESSLSPSDSDIDFNDPEFWEERLSVDPDAIDDDDQSTSNIVSRPSLHSASSNDTTNDNSDSNIYSINLPELTSLPSPPLPPPSPPLPPPSPPLPPPSPPLPPYGPTINTQRPTPQPNPTIQSTKVLLPSEPLVTRVKRQIQGFFRALAGFWKKSDPVDCTVFSPATVSPGITFAVQVFTHRPEQTDVAKAIATDIDPNATRRGFKSLEINVKRGSRLTLCLHIPGLDIDNPVEYLVWNGRAASVLFGVTVPAEASLGNYIGTLMVSHNQIPIGHVKFMVEVSAGTQSPQAVQPLGDVARRYHKAFISYASKDRTEVLKRVQMLAQMKIDYFQDVLHLEPGDRWEKELYRHIDTSDLFLLFWSSSAKESRWVMKEVQYAIARKRGNELAAPEIIPVIIEGPPPVAPPPELAHLHFNDHLIYFMDHSR